MGNHWGIRFRKCYASLYAIFRRQNVHLHAMCGKMPKKMGNNSILYFPFRAIGFFLKLLEKWRHMNLHLYGFCIWSRLTNRKSSFFLIWTFFSTFLSNYPPPLYIPMLFLLDTIGNNIMPLKKMLLWQYTSIDCWLFIAHTLVNKSGQHVQNREMFFLNFSGKISYVCPPFNSIVKSLAAQKLQYFSLLKQ